MSRPIRARAVVIGVIGGLGLTLGIATPSLAAINSLCSVTPVAPTTDGVSASHRTGVSCANGAQLVVTAGSQLQRQETLGWSNPQVMVYSNGAGAASRSVSSSWNCNGTGTRTYRTYGMGRDVNGGETYTYSGSRSLTC